MKWYVYHLIDSRTDEVFYVGKGTGNRMYAHEAEAKSLKTRNHIKCERINSIKAAGHKVIKRPVAYFYLEADAYDFESEQIAAHSGLTNIKSRRKSKLANHVSMVKTLIAQVLAIDTKNPIGGIFVEGLTPWLENEVRRLTREHGRQIWQLEIGRG